MELTAEALQKVEFGAKVRGYDPAEVDNFINEIIEAGEELYERLRRATERATKAEQQLATAVANPVAPEPVPVQAAPASSGSADLARIWERAVSAAESTIEEARNEAQRILEDAQRNSEETVTGAQREASRIAEEAEGQLRSHITQLEAARDQLKGDVDGLAAYLDEEKSRLRVTIANALSALDDYGTGPAAPPETNDVHVPAQQSPRPQSSFAPQPTTEPNYGHGRSSEWQFDEPSQPSQGYQQERNQPSYAPSPEHHEPGRHEPEPQRAQQQDQSASQDDSDPFLAELRRAVRDDGPLGPRDNAASEKPESDDDAIDRLYASDDDDSSFFKRRK